MNTLRLGQILLCTAIALLTSHVAHAANPNLNFTRIADASSAPSGGYKLALTDVNHDGKPDLIRTAVTGIGGPFGVSVQLGNGQGTFGASTYYVLSTSSFCLDVVVADLNNDGHPDILTALNGGSTLLVLPGNGDGTFQSPVSSPRPFNPTSIAVTDFNKDGKLDLILCGYPEHPFEGYVSTMLGNGNGTFSNFSTFTSSQRTEYTSALSVAVGDFNGDGWPDFVVSNPTGLEIQGTVSTFMNLKNNTFARQREFNVPGYLGQLTIADVNADGKPDLMFALTTGYHGPIRGRNVGVALGNGNGTFGQTVDNGTLILSLECPIYSVAPTDNFYVEQGNNIAAGDMDGDGDLDLVVGNRNADAAGNYVAILRNNGSGVFSPARQMPVNNLTLSVNLAQLEGDGSLDILASGNNPVNQIFLSGAAAPVFTSPASATFVTGQNNSFQVTATGVPTPTFNVTAGFLPASVSLSSTGVLSGSPPQYAVGTYTVTIRAENAPMLAATQNFTVNVIAGTPVVDSPTAFDVTATSARLRGTVQSAGTAALTRRGVLYSRRSVNPNPTLGAANVTVIDDGLVQLGTFDRSATGLTPETSYSFRAFAVNSQGTGYSDVAVFQTIALPGSGSFVVTTTADEDDGSSDPHVGAGTSLREAVAYANALGGDRTITFSPNLFANGPATITLSAALGNIQLANLTGTTTIDGPGANLLTINGNSVTRIFRIEGGAARFNGMTIANGLPQGSADGGAIRAFGTLYVNDCVFTGNTGSSGGAIYVGGAGYLTRSAFMNNSATQGGAIANESTVLWIMNCTFAGNSADQGGAFYNSGSGAQARLICSTIANNTATTAGGGVSMINSNTMIAHNTIISGNTAPAGANVSGTLNSFGLSSSLIDADPAAIFTTGTLANNGGTTPTIALKPGGPAIDSGTNSFAVDNVSVALATDQRGKSRVINTTIDIGAYEAPVPPTLGASTVTDITANSATLGGNVTADGSGIISKRGVVYALASQNANPTIGGVGVAEVDAAGAIGVFSVPVAGLQALSSYAFTSFATNESGTVYAPVQTFSTAETPSLIVTQMSDTANRFDGQTSLREALANAESSGGARTITFAPALAGETITLSTAAGNADGWDTSSAFSVTGNITIDGLTTSPGVTLNIDSGAALRHFVVRSGGSLTLNHLNLTGGKPQLASFNRGGAISAFGDLLARNCTFSGNTSPGEGGAIQNWPGAATLFFENCTFSGNTGGGEGSAISANGTQAIFHHLTVANNDAPGSALVLWGTQTTMINSIIAGNSNDAVVTGNGGIFTVQSTNNLLGAPSASGLSNGTNGNQLGVALPSLLLASLGNNGGPTPTIAIGAGSLAVDAGVAIASLTTDQRGTARPQNNTADIGAYELTPSAAAAIPIVDPLGGSYENSVQVSITSTSARTTVRYTLDGSTPSATNGNLYTAPFSLTQPTTVKAIAYNGGWLPSPVASVAFTVLSPLPYWRTLHDLAADGSQDLLTPAGDGVANLIKYAFNLAPNAGDLSRPNAFTLSPGGSAGLPSVGYDGQGRLVIEFVRRKAATNPGITYIVETAEDLTGLQSLDLSGATVVEIGASWERVTVTDPAVTSTRFGRVRVTAP